ncbi:hypothetical protein HDR58_00040 [bacterium]|nr:hypothetical protein [bacterium]
MNQIPSVPAVRPYMVQQQTTYMPVPQQPNYNAVKIDIHNPTVGTQGVGEQYTPQYAQPTMPYYTYPEAQVYNYPPAQQPVAYPPVVPQQYNMPPVAQAPVQQPVQPVEVPAQQPVVTPAIQQQNINVPQPVPVEIAQPVAAPEATVSTPVEEPVAVDKPEIIDPEAVTPQVDLNSFIAKLANPDFDTQAAAMEEIATMVKESPDKATELVDTKVFDALTNIINFDSSKLEGPTKEQIAAREKVITGKEVSEDEKTLANTITPKEQAERNKSYALFTSAIMQKLYADEVTRLSNSTVPLTELPGAITVVDQLKDNPNPMVRASAIEALSYLQNPEYKNDLKTVFEVAKNDQDPGVAEAAKIALDRLDQV